MHIISYARLYHCPTFQVFLFELIHPDFRGPAAACFALMAALGGSTIALLGAIHPYWRINMAVLAGLTLVTMIIIALTLPESPIWLLRKGRQAEAEAAMRGLRGDSEFKEEFEQMKELYGKTITLARTHKALEKNWSLPMSEVVFESMKKKKRLPELPFSFYFLSILFFFVGWSGFSYIALNGPRVFMVRLDYSM